MVPFAGAYFFGGFFFIDLAYNFILPFYEDIFINATFIALRINTVIQTLLESCFSSFSRNVIGSFINNFLNLLLSIICKLPVSICQCSLPVKLEPSPMHEKTEISWRRALTARWWINLLKLNILDVIGLVLIFKHFYKCLCRNYLIGCNKNHTYWVGLNKFCVS